MHVDSTGNVEVREFWDEPRDTQSKDMWTAYQQLKEFMLDLDVKGHVGLRLLFGCFDEGVKDHLSRHFEGDLLVDLDVERPEDIDKMIRRLARAKGSLTIYDVIFNTRPSRFRLSV